ncbi:MAG: AMP-binding protein [Alphaproteobacteria bacterium]|nr:AMP-binding protein [Alphaproteobacteria bacterium]
MDHGPVPSSQLCDLIGAGLAGTLANLLAERARRSSDAVAYREYDPGASAWREHSWRMVARRVACVASVLARSHLAPGDRVAIALPNGTTWVAIDLAAASRGLVVVPLYLRDSPENQAFVLGHAGARLLVVDTVERWRALSPHRHLFPELRQVWVDAAVAAGDDAPSPALRALADVVPSEPQATDPVAPDPNRLATIIYTSGTTGRAKGVMLTHRALLLNAEAVCRVIPPRTTDLFLSCLPLAHAFERTVGYYLPMMAGATVAYARSIETLAEDFRTVRPTAFLGVPRLYERAYAAIRARAGGGAVERAVLRLAVAAGWQIFETAQGRRRRPSAWARLAWPAIDRRVAGPVRQAFGGRVRCAVSGGAALDDEVARFFIAMGVPIVEGYGLTEAAPVIAANSLADNLPGSVGRPLPGIEARATAEGELIVRTPSLMTGYWNDPAQTALAVDAGGWLHTDDIVAIRDGRIFVRGRIKDVLVLATGEKTAPSLIEASITRDPLFRQAFVVGERRPYVAAVVVLDREQWQTIAARDNVAADRPDTDQAAALLLRRLAARLAGFPSHAQIRAVHATFDAWTTENGLLTPTLKIKRDRLERRYAAEIDRLYAGHFQSSRVPVEPTDSK